MGFLNVPGQTERTSPGNVYKQSLEKARGNFGHAGRPGQRGGSAPGGGGGSSSRWTGTGAPAGDPEVARASVAAAENNGFAVARGSSYPVELHGKDGSIIQIERDGYWKHFSINPPRQGSIGQGLDMDDHGVGDNAKTLAAHLRTYGV